MKNHRIWFFAVGMLLVSGLTVAGEPDDYNFSWLDPDKKIHVLQNRRYRKAGKPLFSIMGGIGLSNSYRDVNSIDPRIAYYFSEGWGVEAFYTPHVNRENKTFLALKQASSSAIPVVRQIKSQMGALIHYSPWYAKINMFSQILYFDWYFSGGLGTIQTDLDTNTAVGGAAKFKREDFFAFYLGTGHQYHLSNEWIVRLDLTGAYYQAPLFGNSGESTWYSNYNFELGLGYRL